MGRIAVTIATLFSVACGPSTQVTTFAAPTPPDEVYTCVVRELSRLEYQILDADRAGGFVRAEKERGGATVAVFGGPAYFTTLTVSITPAAGGSDLSVNVARVKEEPGGRRTSSGMVLQGDDKEDAATIAGSCAESA